MSSVVNYKISTNEPDERWEAVLARNARFDGQFVFAVSSTRIYCRPSCPSRRPSRERVTFFDRPEAAEQAGFRPCLRCRPRDAAAGDQKVEVVRRACQLLEQADEIMNLSNLSERLGVSSFHLQRTFKKVMGISPRQYAEACRTSRFKDSIRDGQPITSAMYDAEEARLIAAKEPLPQHLAERAARRERVEERQRQIENDWDWNDVRRLWDPGEAVLSRDLHDAAQLLFRNCIREARLARKPLTQEQLRARTQECISAAREATAVGVSTESKIDPAAAGEHKWRKTVPPVSKPIEPVSAVRGGTKWDPRDPLAEDP